jgi:phospholipid transport system substrate-binding protein
VLIVSYMTSPANRPQQLNGSSALSNVKCRNQCIMRKLCFILLLLLVLPRTINAGDKDPNRPCDPNGPSEINDQNALNEPNEPNDTNEINDPNALNDPNDPNELLSTRWKAIISILRDKNIEQKAKEEQINRIVSPYFDFPLMSKLALGRKHWPRLTSPQREKFTLLFTERLKTSYRKKISLYKDEKLLIKPKVQKNKTIYIPTELISSDGNVDILYKIRRVDKGWKIYDVEIQGVSILLTFRSQFDDILSRGTVEKLLSRLEQSLDN